MFTGEKWGYRNWKAVFMACVDTALATGEYKLLQLLQCLSGEALNVIENLGHSATVYEAAKERLKRRYGGKRRQVTSPGPGQIQANKTVKCTRLKTICRFVRNRHYQSKGNRSS